MNINTKSFEQIFITECERRLFDESLPRLKKCLTLLTQEEIWFSPNSETVSVGNLILHLCGNVRQWIISGLGGAPDTRVRSKEFSEPGPIPTIELLERLEKTMDEARSVLHNLNPKTLLDKRYVQGFDESGISILVHVMEHFSYHLGQIVYFVKSRKAIDLKFYRGIDLNKTG
ncbi:MAG: DinB family protein [bacterium]